MESRNGLNCSTKSKISCSAEVNVPAEDDLAADRLAEAAHEQGPKRKLLPAMMLPEAAVLDDVRHSC